MKSIYCLSVLPLVVSACVASTHSDDTALQKQPEQGIQEVTVDVVRKGTFYDEIVSNGHVVADRFADVYWQVDGVIDQVSVRNGQYVSEGQVLACVESFRLRNALEAAKAALEKSRLSVQEVLIGQGYEPNEDSIPVSVKELAEVRSGYAQALASYRTAEYDFKHSTLRAPIGGLVANLKDRPSNLASGSKAFCRIIDVNSLCADFTVIESELRLVAVGQMAEVTSFGNGESVLARISEINPYVESNGMIRIRARLEKPQGFYEGMNVSVKIRQASGSHLSVPKSAVVLRSGRPVVFTVQNGVAKWCYVETGDENSGMLAVMSGVAEGDTVITSGNTFLAHESSVKIVSRK